MAKRKFSLRLECDAVIELDDAVIQAVDDDWRSSLYDLHTPEEIAEHVGYNLIVNGINLTSMDGWANLERDHAKIEGVVNWDTTAVELLEVDQ
jgi:Ser-tRNA(Ala) deacylase AlaX